MNDVPVWMSEMSAAAARLLGQLVEYLPSIVGAVLLIVAGWLIARALQGATMKLGRTLNAMLDNLLAGTRWLRFQLPPTALSLMASVVFWVVVLFFVAAATRVLGFAAFSDWLDVVVAYIPTLLAGALIILVGGLVGMICREVTAASLAGAGVAHSALFGRAVQAIVLVTAVVLGIDQVGIDVTLLVTIIAIVLGSMLGGLSLAFALGARDFVSNLIGAHYSQRELAAGAVARIGDVEGEVLEVTPTSIVIATDRGRVIVPAKVFNERETVLLAAEKGDA